MAQDTNTEFTTTEDIAPIGEWDEWPGDTAVITTDLGPLTGLNPRKLMRGSAAKLFVRPEALRPAASGIQALVTAIAYEGNLTHVSLLAGATPLSMLLGAGDGVPPPNLGETVTLGLTSAVILPVSDAGG